MKIIAIVSESYEPEYLVQVSKSELAKVAGHAYVGDLRRIGVGTEIEVSKAWSDLANFKAAKARLESAAEVLRAVAQLSDTASESYVIPPEPESTEKQP